MKKIYKLTSENLSNIGGRMGTEYTYPNWEKYFTKMEFAKEFAEKDFWKSDKMDRWSK